MVRLPKCQGLGCKELAVVFIKGKWLCKVCQSIEQNNPNKINGFILKGEGWPGKDGKKT